jgi:hypothetical protein
MTTDHQDDQCQFCGDPLVKRRSTQRYHDGCRLQAYRMHQQVGARLKELADQLGWKTGAVRQRLRLAGCDVCGDRSYHGRGPKKFYPFPAYRVVLGTYLTCPGCAQALRGPALDCPPVVMRWILSRFGTRAEDLARRPSPVVDPSPNPERTTTSTVVS